MHWIFFRTDANRQIGSGHLHRCLILADALSESMPVKIAFLFSDTPVGLHHMVQQKDYVVFSKKESESELAFIKKQMDQLEGEAYMLLLDSDKEEFYSIQFQKAVLQLNMLLAHITFKHEENFLSHLIHNQNILALEQEYQTQNYTAKLLGPNYTILKPRYPELRQKGTSFSSVVKNILVSFGGADLHNVTYKVTKALLELKTNISLTLVVGKLYNELESLQALIASYPDQLIRLYQNTPEMPELMYQADLAITSGGLTAWELNCVGTPNVVISTSWRESSTAALLQKKNLAVYLGHHDEHQAIAPAIWQLLQDEQKRRQLYENGLALVDGNGTRKVVEQIRYLFDK